MLFGGLVMYYFEWYQGVVGILVLCIKECFYCLVIVFVLVGDGMLKGLGCFIQGLYMCDVLE